MQVREYYGTGVLCHIRGDDIYDSIWMPVVPRKGDILWLSSLTRGRYPDPEVLVSKVEWSMDQQSGNISAWIVVRRVNKKENDGTV
jgi:hypothetical protein